MKLRSNRVFSIARKEFFHIIHDPRTLMILFLLPVIQLLMFGYALNLEIQNVEMAVVDYDHSPTSQDLIEQFQGSKFFHVFPYQGEMSDVESLFLSRQARVIMVVPPDFSRRLQHNPATSVQFIIDGADPNAAINIQNYCEQTILLFNETRNTRLREPFSVEPTIWFNPDLKSTYFFVPGILALILVMISALLTSITITREKEMGTLEQILVSPVRPAEIILGKVLPYIFLAFMDASLILLIGILLFHVPFQGSAILLALLTTLYIITALSLGLMISTITHTQQVATMVAQLVTLLPTVMLSGFIFPIASMPKFLQLISYIIPAKYYLIIVRGIMLKGNTLMQLLPEVGFLAAMSTILLLIAWRRFSTNLEA